MADCDPRLREAILTFDLLEGEERVALDAHLRECASCSSRVARIRKIEEDTRRFAQGLWAAHPAPAALYDLASGPGAESLEEDERRVTAAHVRGCEECAREVRRIREVDLEDPVLAGWLEAEAPGEGPEEETSPGEARASLTHLLKTAPRREPPAEAARQTFTVRPRPQAPRETWRRILFPLAAAAAVVLSIVLLPKDPVPPPNEWVVISPGTEAISELGEDRRPLRAGDVIPANRRVTNPGPGTLVLAEVVQDTNERMGRALFLGPGETLAPDGDAGRFVAIPNLTAVLLQPPLPNLRGTPERSSLLYPRLTIRSRRPNFTFFPPEEGGTFRAVLLSRAYPAGESKIVLETAPGPGPTLYFPKEASSLTYDVATYFEWRLEREEAGRFQPVESVEFYLHESPSRVEESVSTSRRVLATQPRASRFFVAQIFLQERLLLAALQELLESDPRLEDAGVIELSRRIARNLKIDLERARPLLPILDLR